MGKDLPTIIFEECEPNQFIMAKNLCSIYEVVKSGDVMPNADRVNGKWIPGRTFAPEACVMRCYWSSSKHPEYSESKKGDIVIDYFKYEFFGPFSQEHADGFIEIFERD